ncbi:mycofactocin-coupled SDR family oxidoreductase [Rhodococcus sovatensis]|uniref:Mycofactocin-coupled SDR family oxidoreductase n=1 Tax=Rhodococcus sovatensis TaxID=1805840 RepID=A0ABZ2PI73_9NOCA
MDRLSGKVAFITGAARGQGRAHALRLASEGADLVLSDICGPVNASGIRAAEPEDLQETVREVAALGMGTRVLDRIVDVRDLDGLQSLADDAVAELGRLDVVIANAGILNWGEFVDITSQMWQDVIDVNLTGVFNTCKATVPHLIRQGEGGSVILISSVAGLKGQPLTTPYTAAKHGVVGIARGLANELAQYSIRVNTVHPAGVTTPMTDVPEFMELIGAHPLLGPTYMPSLPHTLMPPEDVSATIAYLASDDSRMVTGSALRVDMGTLNR